MNNLPIEVAAYLKKYEFKPYQVITNKNKLYKNIIVIPVLNELENIKKLLPSLLNGKIKPVDNNLILFVINNSVNEDNSENLKTIAYLNKEQKEEKNFNIAYIDGCTNDNALPEKDAGVGLARKIGLDTALKYFDYDSSNKNLLICLDADCVVSENYLEEIITQFNKNNYHAGCVNYAHQFDEEQHIEAIINYEIFLRYYVLGLKYAKSPYAFNTIGSTMICDVSAYIKVEGMNKRKAAEDFYFMEKLGKHYKIHLLKDAYVYPSSRESYRVPFGTGRSMTNYTHHPEIMHKLYDSEVFDVLHKWNKLFNNEDFYDAKYYLEQSSAVNVHLYNFLVEQKLIDSYSKILLNSKDGKQLHKQKIRWFDGFRTLKFVHYFRDNAQHNINMFDALDKLFNLFNVNSGIKRYKDIPDVETQKEYMNILRTLT
ncbi:MAG TPA: glycosyltransferase [Ignavibacteriaceae bacterium]|nr:glycosyltransferase [Ignavibacteriaceae bacterium]